MQKYSTQIFSQLIVSFCKQYGVDHIIISPGSRSAPLVIGFSEDTDYKLYSIVDERCAAFFALGIAQQLKLPVALVCTSGSALLNYYPAISEAFYSDIPLVIISADRPAHKIDIGDGQTIRQKGVFANHILSEVNLSEASSENEKNLSKTLQKAILGKGPVHINVPFEEPLYSVTTNPETFSKIEFYAEKSHQIFDADIEEFTRQWNNSNRKIILIGQLNQDEISKSIISEFLDDETVIVFTETTSNIRGLKLFDSIDKIISPVELNADLKKKLRPELLLTIGETIISKKIKSFLRDNIPKYHFHIGDKKAYNTYFCLTHHFKVKPQLFLNQLAKNIKKIESDYRSFWIDFYEKIQMKHHEFLSNLEYSDLSVYQCIFQSIPDKINLHLSNSSTIRYAQLFAHYICQPTFCNRGTSGIEGSVSTAIGASLVSKTPTTLITGDLSFFYDSNGLWNNYICSDFRIIVINNNGGGIFRILKNDENTERFETFFETKHTLSTKHLAEMYNFEYTFADNIESVQSVLKTFYQTTHQPKILEIQTPREVNEHVLKSYFKNLKIQ